MKQSSIKLRQDSSEGGACFVAFRSGEVGSSTSTRKLQMSVKAISIQALSPKKFVILDSVGELHLLHLSNSVIGSDSSCHMKQLPHIMEVQKLSVFPDVSISMLLSLSLSILVDIFLLECFMTTGLVNFNGTGIWFRVVVMNG